jgi:hypothetical protein
MTKYITANESRSLMILNALIFEGAEYPDAVYKVTQRTGIAPERLQELYDHFEDENE